jgi:UDP-glucose 4-epimerase
VTVLDNLSTGHRELVDPRARLVVGDLADPDAVAEALGGCDVVMHMAASSIIEGAYSDPAGYVQNNVMNGTSLLEGMRDAVVKTVIFSSSASVYGEPRRIPVAEDDRKEPMQLYGASKLAFEDILRGYSAAFGINATCLRYFNAYGPGDLQEPVTRAVPAWVRAALRSEPLTLYWGGMQYRDYVYVDDIARAHIEVMGREGFSIYNIGSGSGVLMADVVKELESLTGKTLAIHDGGERRGDPARLVADVQRIRGDTRWAPEVGLRDGLERTLRYYSENRWLWDP